MLAEHFRDQDNVLTDVPDPDYTAIEPPFTLSPQQPGVEEPPSTPSPVIIRRESVSKAGNPSVNLEVPGTSDPAIYTLFPMKYDNQCCQCGRRIFIGEKAWGRKKSMIHQWQFMCQSCFSQYVSPTPHGPFGPSNPSNPRNPSISTRSVDGPTSHPFDHVTSTKTLGDRKVSSDEGKPLKAKASTRYETGSSVSSYSRFTTTSTARKASATEQEQLKRDETVKAIRKVESYTFDENTASSRTSQIIKTIQANEPTYKTSKREKENDVEVGYQLYQFIKENLTRCDIFGINLAKRIMEYDVPLNEVHQETTEREARLNQKKYTLEKEIHKMKGKSELSSEELQLFRIQEEVELSNAADSIATAYADDIRMGEQRLKSTTDHQKRKEYVELIAQLKAAMKSEIEDSVSRIKKYYRDSNLNNMQRNLDNKQMLKQREAELETLKLTILTEQKIKGRIQSFISLMGLITDRVIALVNDRGGSVQSHANEQVMRLRTGVSTNPMKDH
jgi:hypothetical protein